MKLFSQEKRTINGKQYNFMFFIPENDKKYFVLIQDQQKNKKRIYFGDKNYEQYFDKIGYYSKQNHNDKERRKQYYQRHKEYNKIKNINDFSAKYFSHEYLW